jgi:hypothetical protein
MNNSDISEILDISIFHSISSSISQFWFSYHCRLWLSVLYRWHRASSGASCSVITRNCIGWCHMWLSCICRNSSTAWIACMCGCWSLTWSKLYLPHYPGGFQSYILGSLCTSWNLLMPPIVCWWHQWWLCAGWVIPYLLVSLVITWCASALLHCMGCGWWLVLVCVGWSCCMPCVARRILELCWLIATLIWDIHAVSVGPCVECLFCYPWFGVLWIELCSTSAGAPQTKHVFDYGWGPFCSRCHVQWLSCVCRYGPKGSSKVTVTKQHFSTVGISCKLVFSRFPMILAAEGLG